MPKEELSLHEREIGNQIYLFLLDRRGTEQPVTKEELVREFKINERLPRKLVRFLRRKGFPICSNAGDKGFFFADKSRPEDREEVVHTFNDLMSRADDLVETAQGFAKCFPDFGIEVKGRRAFLNEHTSNKNGNDSGYKSCVR